MLSGGVPYKQFKSDLQVIPAISRGELPSKPRIDENDDVLHLDALWDLCSVCWATDPFDRPTASQIATVLSEIPTSSAPFTLLHESQSYSTSFE